MKVLVCGGRTYRDQGRVFSVLDSMHKGRPITRIISGGANGADSLGERWAIVNHIPLDIVFADWTRHGRSAGPIRNTKMLMMKPDWVVAFPGGRGTAHMVGIAKKAKVSTMEVMG